MAFYKLKALVDGTNIVRAEVTGQRKLAAAAVTATLSDTRLRGPRHEPGCCPVGALPCRVRAAAR